MDLEKEFAQIRKKYDDTIYIEDHFIMDISLIFSKDLLDEIEEITLTNNIDFRYVLIKYLTELCDLTAVYPLNIEEEEEEEEEDSEDILLLVNKVK